MRPIILVLALLVSLALGAPSAHAQPPPDSFELLDNLPDPFCGETEIRFEMPQAAVIRLEVRDPADQETVRTLIHGQGMAGFYTAIWDGLDDLGQDVDDGAYPYRLTVTDIDDGSLIFTDTKIANKACSSPIDVATWGAIKALYQE